MLVASDFFDGNFWQEWMSGGVDFAPKAGVSEGDRQFDLNIDLPGFKKDDLRVEVKRDQLVIKGERRQEQRSHNDGYCREERSFGAFERRFTLPDNIDSTNITVGYHDGVLQVTLPKHEEIAPRRLEING